MDDAAYYSELGRLRMLGGDAALDFANTRHWRDGREIDFLTGYPALVDWAVVAGLLSEGEGARLREAEGVMPLQAADVFSATVRLRDSWKIHLGEATRALNPTHQPSEALRRMVTTALGPPDLAVSGLPAEALAGADMALPLARAALAIGAFLALPHAGTLRMCEADPCGGVFLDTSRSQKRRWCAMDSCGNRVKAQRHRLRMKAEAVEPPKGNNQG
ncbi:CGNR zinc finger domain-containing protein [Pleomorphomonas sp. JP5]|uniref:CGNR zinc finger domain-containing protein n=1 Tax=Pleomorphomonas sp. JP5 TaxID=2942998 RepID=UPI002043A5D4|nr:CGNR zinc finger domain-containing protein [Pleomorphomonas sp. JP5]MCM5557597.1 CGNR zinc finger domain-containing protein [Pleomorphomonas sp. JP5]